jgi:hypothetical protein
MDLLAQSPLGTDAADIADQQHPDLPTDVQSRCRMAQVVAGWRPAQRSDRTPRSGDRQEHAPPG